MRDDSKDITQMYIQSMTWYGKYDLYDAIFLASNQKGKDVKKAFMYCRIGVVFLVAITSSDMV